VRKVFDLQLREVSGICERPAGDGRPRQLLAIGDLSDVTVGPDGRVYLLSDESRCVARLQETVPPEGGTVEVDRIWGLPERLHQPEGLDPLIGRDYRIGWTW
jgi:uncharacterized protein YjiK